MKNWLKENWVKTGAFVAILFLGVYILVERVRFPVSYIICDSGYRDCFTVAKFADMQSCQRENEKGDWSCDESDPSNIKCHVVVNSDAVGYCKD